MKRYVYSDDRSKQDTPLQVAKIEMKSIGQRARDVLKSYPQDGYGNYEDSKTGEVVKIPAKSLSSVKYVGKNSCFVKFGFNVFISNYNSADLIHSVIEGAIKQLSEEYPDFTFKLGYYGSGFRGSDIGIWISRNQ